MNVAHVANAAEGTQTTQPSKGTSSWDTQSKTTWGKRTRGISDFGNLSKERFHFENFRSLCDLGDFPPALHFSYWVWRDRRGDLQALGLRYITIYFYTCLEVGFIGTSLTKIKVIICFPLTIVLGRRWHQFAFSWRLVVVSILSPVHWPNVCLLWRNGFFMACARFVNCFVHFLSWRWVFRIYFEQQTLWTYHGWMCSPIH